jgi:ribonuclease P protein component
MVLWRPNGRSEARLGLAVSKKNVRRAVDRNLLKRIIRESFRMRKDDMAGVDVVVLSRRDVPVHEKRLLRDSLEGHWKRLIERSS